MPIPLKFKAALDDSAFMAGMRRINTAVTKHMRSTTGRVIGGAVGMGRAGLAIGGGAVTAGVLAAGAARNIGREADALYNLSRRTGMTTTSLAALAEMGKGANVEMEELAAASVKLGRALTTSEGQRAIEELHLNLGELKKLKPEEQFQKIGAAIGAIGDQSVKLQMTKDLFGKSGSSLFELFDDLGKMDMSKVSKNAQQMGENAKDIADASDTIEQAIVGLKAKGAVIMGDILRGEFLPKLGNALFKRESILREADAAAKAATPAAAKPNPFAGFTTANVTPSVAFRHLRDESQWWGGGAMRGSITGSNDVFAPTSMSGGYGTVRRGDAARRKWAARMLGYSEPTNPNAYGVVSRGDAKRARAQEMGDFKRQILSQVQEQQKTRDEIKKIHDFLEDNFE